VTSNTDVLSYMRAVLRSGAILAGLGLSSAAFAATASSSASFSADYAISGSGPKGAAMTMRGKLWAAHGKVRREVVFEGHVMALIIDTSRNVTLNVVPDQGFYEDVSNKLDLMNAMPGGPADFNVFIRNQANPCDGDSALTCASGDLQMVDGRSCRSWAITPREGDSWNECIDQQLSVVIKKEQRGRSMELTNIKVGKQRPALFQPPPDLRLVVLKGEL